MISQRMMKNNEFVNKLGFCQKLLIEKIFAVFLQKKGVPQKRKISQIQVAFVIFHAYKIILNDFSASTDFTINFSSKLI
jgi:hypothetical protein